MDELVENGSNDDEEESDAFEYEPVDVGPVLSPDCDIDPPPDDMESLIDAVVGDVALPPPLEIPPPPVPPPVDLSMPHVEGAASVPATSDLDADGPLHGRNRRKPRQPPMVRYSIRFAIPPLAHQWEASCMR